MSELITWAPGVSLKEIEKQVIFGAMRHFSKNRKAVANSLGVSERTIDTKLSLYYRESELQKKMREDQIIKDKRFLDISRRGRKAVEDEEKAKEEEEKKNSAPMHKDDDDDGFQITSLREKKR